MKEYYYSKIRTFSFIAAIYLVLLSGIILLLLLGLHFYFMIAIPIAGAIAIPVTYFRLDKKKAYKININKDSFVLSLPYKGDHVDIFIDWLDVKNVTFAGKYLTKTNISVNTNTRKAVFPLTAFGNYKDLLKAIIRRSCDNPGFYADKQVLDILKN